MNPLLTFFAAAPCLTVFFTALPLLSTAAESVTATPELQYSIDNEGNILDAAGKPQLMLGSQYSFVDFREFAALRKGKKKILFPYPAKMEKIYKGPHYYHELKQLGLNLSAINNSAMWLRALFPDYRGFNAYPGYDGSPEELFREISRKFSRVKQIASRVPGWDWGRMYLDFYRKAGMPLYLEATHAQGFRLQKHRNEPEIISLIGADAVAHWTNGSLFFLHYSVVTRSGRDIYLKCWKYHADENREFGGKAFAYELFNEPKYDDNSPFFKQAFSEYLKKKFGTVETMNRALLTDYRDFTSAGNQSAPFPPALQVERRKFMQSAISSLLREGRALIRTTDPEARTTVQLHSEYSLFSNWHGFDFYELHQNTDMVNAGTNGFCLYDVGVSDRPPRSFVDAQDVNALHIFNSRLCLAVADGKPIVDQEMYAGPDYQSLYTRIWTDVTRGANVVFPFSFTGSTGTKADAKKAMYQLLNGFAFAPEDLRAVPDARDAIAGVADFILPRKNREKAAVALVASTPTMRWNYATNNDMQTPVRGAFSSGALAYGHYAFDAIFEEQFKERLGRYRAVVADGVKVIYPASNALLRKYVAAGGVLIAYNAFLQRDEHGKPFAEPLFDFKQHPGDEPVGRLFRLKGKARPVADIRRSRDWETVDSVDGKPVILRRKLGKGTLYAIVGDLPQYSLATVYRELLERHGIARQAEIQLTEKDDTPPNVELYKFRHDGMTAFYLMNGDRYPKLIRLRASELAGTEFLADALNQKRLTVIDGAATLLLKAHTPTLLVAGSADALNGRFGTLAEQTLPEMEKEYAELRRKLELSGQRVTPGRCLNLQKYANSGFDNQQGYTNEIAWFDRKSRYFEGIPWGVNAFNGVECDIIRFDYNENRTCLAFRGKHFPNGLRRVDRIPVNANLSGISFFHAVTFGKAGEKVLTCRIHYRDGSHQDIPFITGRNIGDWNTAANPPELRGLIAYEDGGKCFFRWSWNNPKPDLEVTGISLIGADAAEATPIVLGITVHEAPERRNLVSIPLRDWKLQAVPTSGSNTRFRKLEDGFEAQNYRVELAAPAGKAVKLTPEAYRTAVLKYSYNNKPDQWGFSHPLQAAYARVTGRDGDGKPFDCGFTGSYYGWEVCRSHHLDSDPETWQEIRIPLTAIYAQYPAKRLSEVSRVLLEPNNKNASPALVRDICIEYEAGQ